MNQRFRFPWERRLVLDICRFSQAVPLFPIEATFQLRELADARQRCAVRISWVTLFVRAIGLLSVEYPVLRQSYLRWPWSHLYQHPSAVVSVTVAREMRGQPFVGIARHERPEQRDLLTLQTELDTFAQGDPRQVFREQFFFCRLPGVVRSFFWNLILNAWGRKKSRKFGTFGISTLAGQGVMNRRPLSVLSYTLSYSPLDAHGACQVTLQCDHRVIDGFPAAQILLRLQEILRTQVLAELRQLARHTSAAA